MANLIILMQPYKIYSLAIPFHFIIFKTIDVKMNTGNKANLIIRIAGLEEVMIVFFSYKSFV